MGGESDVCETCRSNIWVRYALFCHSCQKHKHRKCEKIPSGIVLDRYICKMCKRNGVDQNEGDTEVDTMGEVEIPNAEGCEMSKENAFGCEMCDQLAEENRKLAQERDSLKEIVEQLKRDMDELKPGRSAVQEKNTNQWVNIAKKKNHENTNRRKSVIELRNRFEVLGEDGGRRSQNSENNSGSDVNDGVNSNVSESFKKKGECKEEKESFTGVK